MARRLSTGGLIAAAIFVLIDVDCDFAVMRMVTLGRLQPLSCQCTIPPFRAESSFESQSSRQNEVRNRTLRPQPPFRHGRNRVWRPPMQRLTVLFLAGSAILLGQDGPRLSFEVASVKAVPEDANDSGYWRSTGMAPPIEPHATRITFPNTSLIGVLCRAYDLMPPSIHAPEWMGQRRYTISAKVAATSPEGHIPEMLQTLLADRFQMKLHWDTKEESGYSLTVTKGGPKLKESASNTTHGTSMRSNGHLEWTAHTMSDLAAALTVLIGSA